EGSNKHIISHRFTAKELDEETGLYYFGARYLDPQTSRWMSPDPAFTSYVPVAPVSDNAKKHNQNLPGLGGVFNPVNLNLYHYSFNNPLNFIDPNGESGQQDLPEKYGHPFLYLDIFKLSSYNDKSTRISRQNSTTRTFRATIKINVLEFISRVLPTGLGDSRQDAILGFLKNVTNPDLYLNMILVVETDRKKENLLNWYVKVPYPYLDPNDESRAVEWTTVTEPSKTNALNLLFDNPELMYKIFEQTKIEED
ncbi:MAG: RHS repeat-associated core domain-containing protein, partial [Spirochaetales bacterium]|nr:RHS repeat-associated core domain-containing protein [Spirochaetales bacterium]